MRLPTRFRRFFSAFLAFLPTAAFAHPGHDGGHDLTWDFTGEVVHRLTSPYHAVPLFAAAATFFFVMHLARVRKARSAAAVQRATTRS